MLFFDRIDGYGGGMVLVIDEKFVFREKMGVPKIYFFKKLGVIPNHHAPRTASTEKFGD